MRKQTCKKSKVIFDCELPFPTSVNQMYMHTHNDVILSEETRRYYYRVKCLLSNWTTTNQPFQGRLRATVFFHEQDRRRRDINNYTKSLFDALEDLVYVDDKQIDETHLYRAELKSEPSVRVIIEEISEHDARVSITEQKVNNKKKTEELEKKTVIMEAYGELAMDRIQKFHLQKQTTKRRRVKP